MRNKSMKSRRERSKEEGYKIDLCKNIFKKYIVMVLNIL